MLNKMGIRINANVTKTVKKVAKAVKNPNLLDGTKTVKVSSTNLKAVNYDEKLKSLEITFMTNRTYVYAGVPKIVYAKLLTAASKGDFFNRFIKYRYNYSELKGKRK